MTEDRNAVERMRRYRARRRGEDVPKRKPGPARRPSDLGSVPLRDLVWEIAHRLDKLEDRAIIAGNPQGYRRTDPDLEELTVYRGGGPIAGYGGQRSSIGKPHIDIMPASEVWEQIQQYGYDEDNCCVTILDHVRNFIED